VKERERGIDALSKSTTAAATTATKQFFLFSFFITSSPFFNLSKRGKRGRTLLTLCLLCVSSLQKKCVPAALLFFPFCFHTFRDWRILKRGGEGTKARVFLIIQFIQQEEQPFSSKSQKVGKNESLSQVSRVALSLSFVRALSLSLS
jgi:hypothetical protein